MLPLELRTLNVADSSTLNARSASGNSYSQFSVVIQSLNNYCTD